MNPITGIARMRADLAEICGIILGDGHLHKVSNLITISGGLNERGYYLSHVMPLLHRGLGCKPKMRFQAVKNSYYLMLESKKVMQRVIMLGLKRGRKIAPRIPEWILQNTEFKKRFLRGIFDTDGCVKFTNQGKAPYPRARITLQKSTLAKQVELLLNELGFPYSVWKDQRTPNTILNFEMSGSTVNRWFTSIKPKNRKHLRKFHGKTFKARKASRT